jgi:hypothetical protein
MSDLLANLNPEQLAAVTLPSIIYSFVRQQTSRALTIISQASVNANLFLLPLFFSSYYLAAKALSFNYAFPLSLSSSKAD